MPRPPPLDSRQTFNKACQYLDLVGWQDASAVLPSLVGGLCRAQRAEEQNAWRNPIDLVALLGPHLARLPDLPAGDAPLGDAFDPLVSTLLDEDPAAAADAFTAALERNVAYAALGQAAAHAPTPREQRQTYTIALRLQRGDDLTVTED